MSENNNTESSPILNAPERTVGNDPETHVLAQEETYEQMKIHIAPLTRQLVHMTGLIQGMSTAQQPISYPRACTGASFNAAGYQPDKDAFGDDSFWKTLEVLMASEFEICTLMSLLVGAFEQRSSTIAMNFVSFSAVYSKKCSNCSNSEIRPYRATKLHPKLWVFDNKVDLRQYIQSQTVSIPNLGIV